MVNGLTETSPHAAADASAGRPFRVVYLVWTHTQPEQIMRLLRTLRALSPHAPIVVHHDPRGCDLDEAAVTALGGVSVLYAAEPVRWGDVSVLDALIRCLRWVHENLEYDWVVHLSGQDYPLRPLAELEERLAAGRVDGHIIHNRLGTQDEVANRRDEAVRRYYFQYYELPRLRVGALVPARLRHALRRRGEALKAVPRGVYLKPLPRGGGFRFGLRARRSPFRGDFACYKGSLWVSLSRRAVDHLLSTLNARPDLYRYYRRTINPDESITATILANDPAIRLDGDSLRYGRWSPNASHPDVLTVAHLGEMLASGNFFARKFDVRLDSAVIDEIDVRLGRAAPSQVTTGS